MEVGKSSVSPFFRRTGFSHSEKATACPCQSRPTVLYSELSVLPSSDNRSPGSSLFPTCAFLFFYRYAGVSGKDARQVRC